MKGKRHTTEERIRILRKAETGKTVAEVIREHGICPHSFGRGLGGRCRFAPLRTDFLPMEEGMGAQRT